MFVAVALTQTLCLYVYTAATVAAAATTTESNTPEMKKKKTAPTNPHGYVHNMHTCVRPYWAELKFRRERESEKKEAFFNSIKLNLNLFFFLSYCSLFASFEGKQFNANTVGLHLMPI